MKTGLKSTEFWLTVIAMVGCFVLLALGKVQSIQEAIGAAGAFLALFGYSISRGMAKGNAEVIELAPGEKMVCKDCEIKKNVIDEEKK